MPRLPLFHKQMMVLITEIQSRSLRNVIALVSPTTISGPGSSVGIATGYGLDGPGIEKKKLGGS
jgi:hypothetical protein